MATDHGGGLKEYCLDVARRAKAASAELVRLTSAPEERVAPWQRAAAPMKGPPRLPRPIGSIWRPRPALG